MKIILPENISEITLEQFQKYNDIVNNKTLTENEKYKLIISVLVDLDKDLIDKISVKDYKEIIDQLTTALNTPSEFQQTFKLNNIEFGFIPNLDNITTAEFIDLQEYQTDIDDLNKVMAILFRPITNKDSFGNYQIENYKGTSEYSELMKQAPMNIVNGALGFFLNLSNELENYTQKYLEEELAKAKQLRTTS